MRRFALLLAGLAACATPDKSGTAAGGGTLVISTAGDPNSLFPPLVNTVQGRQVTDLVYDRLASLGDSLYTIGDRGFIPGLAKTWTWSADSTRITFHLDPKARWHDGAPVTSADVRFTLAAYRDSALASTTAPLLSAIDSVSAPDSLTAVFWFKSRSPEQFYNATDQMSIIPEHIWRAIPVASWRTADQANHPVGSGRFRFLSWTQGESLTLIADSSNYRGRPKLDRVIWSIAPDFNTALARFLGGQTDFFEAVRSDIIGEITKHPDLRVVTVPGVDYSFLQFNLRDPKSLARPHPIFGDREVRRALTMAVDRMAIVRSIYDTLAAPALGATIRAYPTTDPTLAQIPFDLTAARKTLDSIGWRDANGDGVREKNGRELAFSILVPSSSRGRVRMAVLLQEQLRSAGARVTIEQTEFPTFVERGDKHSFDALMTSLHSDPSPGAARGDWESSGIESGNNSGYYSNPAFDAAVDSALGSYDPAGRRALFSRAYRIITDDAPAIWLAEPMAVVGVNRRIRTVGLRGDAWWQHIAEWWIPAGERISRDFAVAPADSARKAR
ncbi:MAG: peptide ABC transporter substrate-binding protein [Gemmatimonadota bacterium]|nr:peptide ABC transporter substrate-binding protein [Gemmatimonadota bacterium]